MVGKEKKIETIGLQNQSMYSAEQLKEELVSLRDLIRQLAASADADNHCISLAEYENKMWVLNWLIEKIEFKDK